MSTSVFVALALLGLLIVVILLVILSRLSKSRDDSELQEALKRQDQTLANVSTRLQLMKEDNQKQLAQMQALAKDVDNLQRVLTNVKTRGIWGELQAQRILEEILLPEQFDMNVATKKGSLDRVEFAVKLPGVNEGEKIYLPIDSKFPLEDYERLCDALQRGDSEQIRLSRRALEIRILNEAKDIRDKYIDVPYTTDFGVLFLPVEGLYVEVLSIPGLQERLQRDFHIMVIGPATLAGLLNSLQMGFRTLAIEKKSSEVWQLLGQVKSEYLRMSGVLESVKKKLALASNEIDNAFTRHRAMERRLRDVETVEEVQEEQNEED